MSDEFPISKLTYSQHISLYMEHLHSLNLAEERGIKGGDYSFDAKKKPVASYIDSVLTGQGCYVGSQIYASE
jgi:hypothetical protein